MRGCIFIKKESNLDLKKKIYIKLLDITYIYLYILMIEISVLKSKFIPFLH